MQKLLDSQMMAAMLDLDNIMLIKHIKLIPLLHEEEIIGQSIKQRDRKILLREPLKNQLDQDPIRLMQLIAGLLLTIQLFQELKKLDIFLTDLDQERKREIMDQLEPIGRREIQTTMKFPLVQVHIFNTTIHQLLA